MAFEIFVPSGNRPLLGTMLIYHLWGPYGIYLRTISLDINQNYNKSVGFENYTYKLTTTSPREPWITTAISVFTMAFPLQAAGINDKMCEMSNIIELILKTGKGNRLHISNKYKMFCLSGTRTNYSNKCSFMIIIHRCHQYEYWYSQYHWKKNNPCDTFFTVIKHLYGN